MVILAYVMRCIAEPKFPGGKPIVDEKLDYEYQGYMIAFNPDNRQWQVLWRERVQAANFKSSSGAEQWIDDLVPLNR